MRKEKVDVIECVIVCSNVYPSIVYHLLEGRDCVELKESNGMD